MEVEEQIKRIPRDTLRESMCDKKRYRGSKINSCVGNGCRARVAQWDALLLLVQTGKGTASGSRGTAGLVVHHSSLLYFQQVSLALKLRTPGTVFLFAGGSLLLNVRRLRRMNLLLLAFSFLFLTIALNQRELLERKKNLQIKHDIVVIKRHVFLIIFIVFSLRV